MNRKAFLKNSLLGLWGLATAKKHNSTANMMANQVGFNHLPNIKNQTMKTVLHKANTRGHANHGWLDSHHTFSFANYYNPERMNFGVLRVLNDDIVAAGRGFGSHPHDNMEIISIPLAGALEHKDSMGTSSTIEAGDIQVMSAGTGIYHSEYNKNSDKEVKFLQIWVIPKQRDVAPRYDQITLDPKLLKNNLYQILSPNADDDGVWIHQDAWFHLGHLDAGIQRDYQFKGRNHGLYAFILSGEVKIGSQDLQARDGYGIWDIDQVTITASKDAQILLMEVPLSLN